MFKLAQLSDQHPVKSDGLVLELVMAAGAEPFRIRHQGPQCAGFADALRPFKSEDCIELTPRVEDTPHGTSEEGAEHLVRQFTGNPEVVPSKRRQVHRLDGFVLLNPPEVLLNWMEAVLLGDTKNRVVGVVFLGLPSLFLEFDVRRLHPFGGDVFTIELDLHRQFVEAQLVGGCVDE